tara:strand:+ start:160 stop:1215 length:1056 start_codon:yes stop_codon:yes gene_type:complete
MGIFNEFYKKEKPFFTGIARGFGFGGGGGASGAAAPNKASGGVKFSDATYTYHIFVQGDSTNFTANETIPSCHVICVGGGGGGANGQAGGGGGSSVGYLPNATLPAQTYPVSVGSGGASAPNTPEYSVSGNKGGDSAFGGTDVIGGGGGLRNNYGYDGNPSQPGRGGNAGGGGGGSMSGPGPAADGKVTSQPGGPLNFTIYGGFNGAPAANKGDGCGGGGGGAGGESPGPGPQRPSSDGSPGGAGRAIPQFPGPGIYPLMPSPLQSTLGTAWRDALGPTGLFGGGGGGGDDNSTGGGGAGGPGGGGQGGDDNQSSQGGVNGTGGGAGDRGAPGDAANPGGGNGIVIVRYPV